MDNSLSEFLTRSLPQVNPYLMDTQEFENMVNDLLPTVLPDNDLFEHYHTPVGNRVSIQENTTAYQIDNRIPSSSHTSLPGYYNCVGQTMFTQHEHDNGNLMKSEEFESLLTNMLFGSSPPAYVLNDSPSIYDFQSARNPNVYPNMNFDLSNDTVWEEEDTVIYSIDEDTAIYSSDEDTVIYSIDEDTVIYSIDEDTAIYSSDEDTVIYSIDEDTVIYSIDEDP